MKPRLPILMLALAGLLAAGCARFHTKQTDVSTQNPDGTEIRTVTTIATGYAILAANSKLAQWSATQTDKTQRAAIAGLDQQSQAIDTNAVAWTQAVISAVLGAALKTAKP